MLRCRTFIRSVSVGELGNGSGKAGGEGGTIRQAGGAFGKMEAAREEEYFYRKEREQISALKEQLMNEVERHEQLKKSHEEAVVRNKKRIAELEEQEKKLKN
uniref:ATPase inhibitor, mitochondrial n=1 Tax=Syphacia muris TaxID=451379 RepID=A0A0N5ALZ9_9BILA